MARTLQQNVPDLRFPEFSGEWESQQLGEIVKIERGRFSPRPRNDPKYYGGEFPFVQTSDVVKSKGRIWEYSQTLNDLGLGVSKLFPKGTLLITIAANIGYAGVLEQGMACPDSLIGLTCSKSINNYFLNYILEIEQPKMDYLAVEAAQKNINIEFLRPYRIASPSVPEQQKIASFLSSVDGKIEQLAKKKNLLEQYKKGMMQKLFSQELRFKDEQGNDFPDWEEKRLNQLSSEKLANGVFNDPAKVGSGYRLINVKEMYTTHHIDGKKLNRVAISEKEFSKNKALFGDIFFTRSSLVKDGIAYSNVFLENSEETTFDGHLIRFRPDQGLANPIFLFHLLKSDPLRRQLVARGKTGTMTTIGQEDISSVMLNIPHLKEQQKIANFLSAIDEKIDLVSTELDHAKTFKKGLLQQMFV